MKGIKNDNDELGFGRPLDDEIEWLGGDTIDSTVHPTEPISTVPVPSTTETFDIDHHERLNEERTVSKNIYSAYHHIVTICDFLGNFPKLSTKNTTKLENSSHSYVFEFFIVTIWWYTQFS